MRRMIYMAVFIAGVICIVGNLQAKDEIVVNITTDGDASEVNVEYGKKKKNFKFEDADIEKIKEQVAKRLDLTEDQLADADINIKRAELETVGIVKKTSGDVKKISTHEPVKDKKADVKIVIRKDSAAIEIGVGKDTQKFEIKDTDAEKLIKEIERETGFDKNEMKIVVEDDLKSGGFIKKGEEIITAIGGMVSLGLGEDVDIVLAENSVLSIDDIREEGAVSDGKVNLNKGKSLIKTGSDTPDFQLGMSSSACIMKKDTTIGVNIDAEGEIGVGIVGDGAAEFKTQSDKVKIKSGEWVIMEKMYKEIKKSDSIPEELNNDFKKMKDYMKASIKIKLELLAGAATAGMPFEMSVGILNEHNNTIKSAQGVVQIQSNLKGVKYSADSGITWDAHGVVINEGEGKIMAESEWSGKIQISATFQDVAGKLDIKVNSPAKRTIKLTLEDKDGRNVDVHLKLKRK